MKYMQHPAHGVMPVDDTVQEAIALRAGWTLIEAPTKAIQAPDLAPEVVTYAAPVSRADEDNIFGDDPAESEIDKLRLRAIAAGIQVDGRWGAARLEAELARVTKRRK